VLDYCNSAAAWRSKSTLSQVHNAAAWLVLDLDWQSRITSTSTLQDFIGHKSNAALHSGLQCKGTVPWVVFNHHCPLYWYLIHLLIFYTSYAICQWSDPRLFSVQECSSADVHPSFVGQMSVRVHLQLRLTDSHIMFQ